MSQIMDHGSWIMQQRVQNASNGGSSRQNINESRQNNDSNRQGLILLSLFYRDCPLTKRARRTAAFRHLAALRGLHKFSFSGKNMHN